MPIIEKWEKCAKELKQELHAIYIACKDPRTPWYAKALAACVVGYALSPIDLIPDPIPILGYMDDFILLPLGIAAVRRMIPPAILAECREKAKEGAAQRKSRNLVGAGVIVSIWIVLAVLAFLWLKKYFF
jgi:uncharacterized membrane protein YkvA (DUF1232 family)